jgi:hypothetical protein
LQDAKKKKKLTNKQNNKQKEEKETKPIKVVSAYFPRRLIQPNFSQYHSHHTPSESKRSNQVRNKNEMQRESFQK